MSSILYEPIMNALLALLQTNCHVQYGGPFQTVSRKFITIENLVNNTQIGTSPVKQPALYLYDGVGFGGGIMTYEPRGRGTPGVRIMKRTIVCYSQIQGWGTTPQQPDALTAGGTTFAPLVEAIENAFNPDQEGALTLITNGKPLVSHCWIQGDSYWVTGDIDPNGQGMLTIPLQIMIP